MPRDRSKENEQVLCIVCHQQLSKKSIRDHRKNKHGLTGGRLRDHILPLTAEALEAETFQGVKKVADPEDGYYAEMGMQFRVKTPRGTTYSRWFNLRLVFKINFKSI